MRTRIIGLAVFTVARCTLLSAPTSFADFPNPDATNLPPRTLIASPHPRDIPQ
ncbi:MAG: hypothetical protein HY288_12355 [Planctomycetia bacterium]|nr:hypothetical protein [Planctomycetia bacterium]